MALFYAAYERAHGSYHCLDLINVKRLTGTATHFVKFKEHKLFFLLIVGQDLVVMKKHRPAYKQD